MILPSPDLMIASGSLERLEVGDFGTGVGTDSFREIVFNGIESAFRRPESRRRKRMTRRSDDRNSEQGTWIQFSARMLQGESPTIFGDGNQTRDYVFVDDAVHAFALAIEGGSGRLVNVGTGLETSVNGLFRILGEITGFHGQPLFGPQPPAELRRICLDIGAAQEVLGWHPWTHLEDGLKETVAFMRGP